MAHSVFLADMPPIFEFYHDRAIVTRRVFEVRCVLEVKARKRLVMARQLALGF